MPETIGDIWKFANNPIDYEGSGSTAPPILVGSGSGFSTSSPGAPGMITLLKTIGMGGSKFPVDVVNDFYWTHTPLTKRQEVPFIYLSEKRLKTNALVAQAAYNIMTVNSFQPRVTGVIDKLFNTTLSEQMQKLRNFLQASGNSSKLGGTLGGLMNGVREVTDNDPFSLPRAGGARNVLNVYQGLYITEPTGWEYTLPYFEDYQNGVSNNFSDNNQADIGGGILAGGAGAGVQGTADLAGGLAASMNIKEPGTYIEKPKFYQFDDSGDDVTISFPLLNTGHATYQDVIRNWQFIYLLVYQNRPVRFTRDLIEPPVIYEVSLPGFKYMPYAYISKLEVQFQGSRRPMNIFYKDESSLGQGNNVVNTIIPDGYNVQITLKGLVAETRNFLYTSLNADPVSVTSTGI